MEGRAHQAGEKRRKDRVGENRPEVFARDGEGAGEAFPQRYPGIQAEDRERYPRYAVHQDKPEKPGIPCKIGLCRVSDNEKVDKNGRRVKNGKGDAEEQQPSLHPFQSPRLHFPRDPLVLP